MDAKTLQDAGLLYDVAGPVATITLHRREVRNAQTPTMWHALAAIGDELPDDVRVVVLKGTGAAFSAGLDRSMLDPSTGGEGSVVALMTQSDEEVAAVHGYAIGAGFQLALSCDLRVVADDAQFCMKESALGLVPDLTGTKPLVESVGYARALEICVTARMVGAAEAVSIGLALTSVPTTGLDDAVADLAAALIAPPPGAAVETKTL